MPALHALFNLLAVCIICAALCFVVYGLLRLFGRRFPIALYCFGALSFVIWGVIFMGFALLAGASWDDVPIPAPYPWKFVVCVGGILMGTLVSGWRLLHKATQKPLQWWQGFLFSSLYLMAAYALCGIALTLTTTGEQASNAWSYLAASAKIPTHTDGFTAISALLLWLFPLGAPVAEIGILNFQRVFKTYRETYPV